MSSSGEGKRYGSIWCCNSLKKAEQRFTTFQCQIHSICFKYFWKTRDNKFVHGSYVLIDLGQYPCQFVLCTFTEGDDVASVIIALNLGFQLCVWAISLLWIMRKFVRTYLLEVLLQLVLPISIEVLLTIKVPVYSMRSLSEEYIK
jgi:hypothetical protein